MMHIIKYSVKFQILLASLLITGCATSVSPIIVQKPKPVEFYDVKFHVVTQENISEFTDTYIVISISDYEKLSLNMSEIQRYIRQQQNIINYYENTLYK